MRSEISRVLWVTALGAAAAVAACDNHLVIGPPPLDERTATVILDWNVAARDVMVAADGYANPMAASRVLAMVHLAQHDAVNAVDPRYESYAFDGRDGDADPVAAAAAAAHGVLVLLFPDHRQLLDERLAQSLYEVADGSARFRGIALGAAAAAAIVDHRQDDGSDTPLIGDYTPVDAPGRYQFTPPAPFAAQPGWRYVTPFSLNSPDQFRPEPPPALASAAYATALNEVKVYGSATSVARSEEQTTFAHFWYEFSDIGWNRIARVVTADNALGLQSAARMFALLNMALADSYIAGWDGKFHYDLWRPYTAIRAAAGDGNAATEPDTQWEPALATPPVQDYPSTHSALGSAGAIVLAHVFGEQTSFAFTSTSAQDTALSRSFGSFSQAANENAESRIMAGLHFRFACDAGMSLGRNVGEWTVANHLRRL
jgi:hypothetical protein